MLRQIIPYKLNTLNELAIHQSDSLFRANIPLLLQMNWAAGTQCVTKRHHGKPKPGELAYQKGEIVTVVDLSTVLWVQ